MKQPSQLRGRIVITSIVLIWLVVTIIFGFVIDRPTVLVGLSMIIIFLIFLLAVGVMFSTANREIKKYGNS